MREGFPSAFGVWPYNSSNISDLLDQETSALTANVMVRDSAFAGQYYVSWTGTNGKGYWQRINPRGPDLKDALDEFVSQCARMAKLPKEPRD